MDTNNKEVEELKNELSYEEYKNFHKENFKDYTLTNEEKIKFAANSPEIVSVVKFLAALFVDTDCENYLQIDYDWLDVKFRLKFEKINP